MREHTSLRRVVPFLIVGLVAAVTLCCSKKENPESIVTVQTAIVEPGRIQQVITTEAVLFPKDQAALTPKISAPVKAFYVNRGSRVHQGELLAVLENRDLAAAALDNKGVLEQAEGAYGIATSSSLPEEWQKAGSDLQTAKQEYEAQQKIYDSRQLLFQQGALPRKDFDQAAVALIQAKGNYELAQKHLTALQTAGKKDQLKSAKGQLTSAEGKYQGAAAQLSYSEIRSPINGVVTERPLYPGETAAAGTPLLVVMDTSSVIARAHIPQSDAAALKPGDAATISGPGGTHVNGKVTLVSPAVDPNSTTIEVWVEAPNPAGSLHPGTTAKVQMIARTVDDALIVPTSALLKTPEGATTVMVVGSDSKARQVSVEPGIRNGDRVQITKGLNGGEMVITSGGYGLPDNTRVKIVAVSSQPAGDNKEN
jgi:HlyD family secretion protein